MRREAKAAAIGSWPCGARDVIDLVQRLVQFSHVERGRLERHDRGRPGRIRMRPHANAVDACQPLAQRLREKLPTCKITGCSIEQTVPWVIWFVLAMLGALLLVLFIPELALFLPRLLGDL